MNEKDLPSSAVSRFQSLLDSIFRIRPGETARAGLMFVYLMAVVSTFIVGRTVRDTLFLSRYPLERLPWMYVAVAFSTAATGYAYGRVVDRHRRDLVILTSLRGFIVILGAFWFALHFDLSGGWLYPALYVVVEIIGALSIIQFWTFANDVYSAREAKRLFGVIGAGGVLSNVTCGFLIGGLAPLLGSENLLLISVLLLSGCTFVVRRLAKTSVVELEGARARPRRRAELQLLGNTLHGQHLKLIAGIVIATFLTVTVTDYQFKLIAQKTYQEGELASFFGFFYGFTGILASVVQFSVTSRVLEKRGVVTSLAILPVGLLFGAGAMILVPVVSALAAVTLAKGAENIFRYTVNDATMQILFVPVPPHLRGRAKAWIDGILKPISIGLAGVGLMIARQILPADRIALDLAYVDVALILVWIAFVIRIRREYVRALIGTLDARRLDLSGPANRIMEDATLQLLKTRLRSSNDTHVLHALDLLPSVDDDFEAELLLLLDHPSKPIRLETLRLISSKRMADGVAERMADRISKLMSDPDDEVQSAALRAYSTTLREKAVPAIRGLLLDKSPLVRAASACILSEHAGPEGTALAMTVVTELASNPEAKTRLQAARALGGIKDRTRAAISLAIHLLGDTDRAVSAAAANALITFGERAEPILCDLLADPRQDVAIRGSVAKVLTKTGGLLAFTQLLACLDAQDRRDLGLGAELARAAARIRERLQLPDKKIHDALLNPKLLGAVIRREIREAYQNLATIADLEMPAGDLLLDALSTRHQRKLALVFRLLEIAYPPRTIQLIHRNALATSSKETHENAIELADNVLSKDEFSLLVPLLEHRPLLHKVKTGMTMFSIARHGPETWLSELLADSNPWIVTCALHRIGEERLRALRDQVATHLKASNAVVSETAHRTMERLSPSKAAQELLDPITKT